VVFREGVELGVFRESSSRRQSGCGSIRPTLSIAPGATVRQQGDTRLRSRDWHQRQRDGLATQCQQPLQMPQCLAQPLGAELLPVHGTGVSRAEVNLHKRAIEVV
jgi:hypothetical protein